MTTALALQLIDDRNRDMWEEVRSFYNVQTFLFNTHHYFLKIDGMKVELRIPEDNISKELFTHELLRLYLRKKKILISDYLIQQLKREPLLKWTLTENLMENLGAMLEDVKLLPVYLNRGFELEKFKEDFEIPVCSHLHIQRLFAGMKKTIPSPASIEMFIHQFFAMKTNPDPDSDYSQRLTDLENIKPCLYDILDAFWTRWLHFDIGRYHPTDYTYKTFTASFLHELGKWTVEQLYAKEKVV